MVVCGWTLSLQNNIYKYVLLHHVIVLKRAGKQETGKIVKQMKTSVAKQKPWRKNEQAGAFEREDGAQK